MSDRLIGEAYIHSLEKRRFDVAFARFLIPLEAATRAIAVANSPAAPSPYFSQLRVGENEELFSILKLETLEADLETPISPLHQWYRTHGVDELAQIRNILAGEMTAIGRRPIRPEELSGVYDTVGSDLEGAHLVDRYRATVAQTVPGLLSSFAIHSHTMHPLEPAPRLRLELDIRDYEQASRAHSARLIRTGLSSLVQGKFKNGSIPNVSLADETS
jgi:lipopolysaccharide/colanic/teichoic acid biosynthesis glycosyltransferase